MKHIRGMVSNLVGAGSSTVRDTIEWALLYLAMHQDVQDKVFAEIKAVIGVEQPPNYSDRARMPYIQAVIQETLRISSLIPINLPHM